MTNSSRINSTYNNRSKSSADDIPTTSLAPRNGREISMSKNKRTLGSNLVDYTLSSVCEIKDIMKENAAPVVRTRTVKARIKKPLPLKILILTFFCSLTAIFMIVNFVTLNEVNMKISKTKLEIEKAEKESVILEFEIDQKNNIPDLYSYAKNDLGMVSENRIHIVYLNLDDGDNIESFENFETDRSFFGELLSAIGDNFSAYWNIFTGN